MKRMLQNDINQELHNFSANKLIIAYIKTSSSHWKPLLASLNWFLDRAKFFHKHSSPVFTLQEYSWQSTKKWYFLIFYFV